MIEDEHYDPTLWFVAFDGDEIAGGSICRRESWEDPDAGWVRSLFVLRPWRRNGLALALLHHSFGEFKRVGKHRVGLGMDAENRTGARGLYKKAGMRIKRQNDRYELELCPGVELNTQ
jgi:GNAT superfamily N-acetyltransferase